MLFKCAPLPVAAVVVALATGACRHGATAPSDSEVCTGFPDWQTSPYVLPFPPDKPHLHLSVFNCDLMVLGTANCPTEPLTFRNTDPNPQGLERGRTYTAR